jgi:hypothetical protein
VIKFIILLLVVMAISRPAAAHDTKIVVGRLINFDKLTNEVFLDDGRIYYGSPRVDFSLLVRGERFFIEFVRTRSRKNIVAMIPLPVMEEQLLTSVND